MAVPEVDRDALHGSGEAGDGTGPTHVLRRNTTIPGGTSFAYCGGMGERVSVVAYAITVGIDGFSGFLVFYTISNEASRE